MSDEKNAAKAAKKAAKGRSKAAKKAAAPLGEAVVAAPGVVPAPAESKPGSLTPAERSAAAAERQARLHALRVWISLLMLLLAVTTFLLTARPWTWFDRSSGASRQTPVESTAPGPPSAGEVAD